MTKWSQREREKRVEVMEEGRNVEKRKRCQK